MAEHPYAWQELLAQAAEPTGPDPGTATRLASSGGDRPAGGAGARGPVLQQHSAPWRTAASVARALGRGMSTAKDELGRSHGKVRTSTDGLSSIAALTAVRESWETRLVDAQAECASLDVKLRHVSVAHNENEHVVRDSFAKTGEQGAEVLGQRPPRPTDLVNGASLPPAPGRGARP